MDTIQVKKIVTTGSGTYATFEDLEKVTTGAGRKGCFIWNINSGIKVHTSQDGFRVAEADGEILKVTVCQGQRGKTGSTIYDLNLHVPTKPITTQRNATVGVTMYTTQANRPTITGATPTKTDNAVVEAALPDVVDFVAGDMLSIDVDQKADRAKDAEVKVFYKYK